MKTVLQNDWIYEEVTTLDIGIKIGEYLKSNGISQSFLSSKIGMNTSKLNLSLNGKRRLSLDEYESICWALGLGVEAFLEPKPPDKRRES